MKIVVRTSLLAYLVFAGFSLVPPPGKADRPGFKSEPAAAEVKIDNFSFGPQSISVSVGTKVVWTNRDDIPHTVVSSEQVFRSRALDTGESFSFTFEKPGRYQYFCSLHSKMTGQVNVR